MMCSFHCFFFRVEEPDSKEELTDKKDEYIYITSSTCPEVHFSPSQNFRIVIVSYFNMFFSSHPLAH